MPEKNKLLNDIVFLFAKEAGVEVFDLQVKVYQGTANIELLVDRPGGGVSLDECAQLNRKISKQVEEENLYGDDYTVGVSSPGLDWPLKTLRDFCRVVGRNIEINYFDKSQDKELRLQGKLESVSEEFVLLETEEGEVSILLEHIRKAVLMI